MIFSFIAHRRGEPILQRQKEELINQITEQIFQRLSSGQDGAQQLACRAVCIERDADTVRFFIECGVERFGLHADRPPDSGDLARYIDHTLLKPVATRQDIEQLCQEAVQYNFASVCVNPAYVAAAARAVRGSQVAVCSVVGFPLGANTPDVKAYEARRCIFDGAGEIDMVINVGALKGGMDELVLQDIQGVAQACHESGAICKVIIEAAYLSDEEKVKACTLAREARSDFVKTSTGFGPGGATVDDVALMRRTVGPGLGVKAAGGIGDTEATRKMLEAGATRIGASAGVKIVQQVRSSGGSSY